MMTDIDVFNVFSVSISWIIGNIICSSIIIVYINEWKRKQKFSVSNKITFYMTLTNLLFQSCIAINSCIYIFLFYQVISSPGYVVQFVFNTFFIYDNIWHSTWLSIHYCLKLVNPSHSVFIQMNKGMSTSIISMLIVTSAGVFLNNLPFIWTLRMELPTNKTTIGSVKNFIIHQDYTVSICNMIIGCCLPFVVTLIYIGLSVGSLVRHMWRMRRNASQFSSSLPFQGHVRATMTMILQLLINVFLFLSVIGVFAASLNARGIWDFILWNIFLFYPSAQTLTLILGNPKLKTEITWSTTQFLKKIFFE